MMIGLAFGLSMTVLGVALLAIAAAARQVGADRPQDFSPDRWRNN